MNITEVSSLQSQAAYHGWQAGVFHFGKAKIEGLDYFNCAIIRRPDGLWLIVRRSRWVEGVAFGMNDLMAFSLDDNLAPKYGIPAQPFKHFDGEHFEDPRTFYHNDKTYVSCCTFIWEKRRWTGAHQILCEFDNRWQCVKRYDPDYGGNGHNTGFNKQHNKNWLWFFYDNKPHMIYWADPHTVVEMVIDPKKAVQHRATELPILSEIWNYGEIRGGTNPVLIGDEWYTFFHSSTAWTKSKRQYHMGAYAFENKPPFRITRITLEPLLSGSKHDRWHDGKPLVVFPCGNLYENDTHLVTYGINDLDCGWVKIPHADLLDVSLPLNPPEILQLPAEESNPT